VLATGSGRTYNHFNIKFTAGTRKGGAALDRDRKNKVFYGLGTLGRDMGYCLMGNYLVVYMTEVLDLPDATLWWITAVMTVLRVFDALNDPIMGLIVDNTESRWGKFKPWILSGAILSALLIITMFTDLNLSQTPYLILFTLVFIGWDLFGGANDTAYWSMLTAISVNQRDREKAGAFARICANIGLFTVVIFTLPATNALSRATGNVKSAWFIYAVVISALMVLFQLFTLLGVKEHRGTFRKEEKITLRGMISLLARNDQLLAVTLATSLFLIGYYATTGLGLYYFKYILDSESQFPVFAAVLGAAQVAALSMFPFLSRRLGRERLMKGAVALMIAGYAAFLASPPFLWLICMAGVMIFIGSGCVQLLTMMLIADTVEYGQWKNGKRSASLTFSLQPVTNKIGAAAGSGIIGATLILSGINSAGSASDITQSGMHILKISMLALPMCFVAAGYIVYKRKYRIDARMHEKILGDLRDRGELLGDD
jgi:sugar (glycoside-pentoside-hexuronide) transporter